MPKQTPCRLSVILARKAPTGVIFRRGPTKWVRLIKWNLQDDTFEMGHWLNGRLCRLYEKRCDLSPDGDKLLYSAWHQPTSPDSIYPYWWQAICYPPWLDPMLLWRWSLESAFLRDNGDWIETDVRTTSFYTQFPSLREKNKKGQEDYWYEDNVFFRRLKREGWKQRQEWVRRYDYFSQKTRKEASLKGWDWKALLISPGYGYVTEVPMIFEKPHPRLKYSLKMAAFSAGCSTYFRYGVNIRKRNVFKPLESVTWADWDYRGRLVYARYGKLFARELDSGGHLITKVVADFNAMKPSEADAFPTA